jgi:hypothetical protein
MPPRKNYIAIKALPALAWLLALAFAGAAHAAQVVGTVTDLSGALLVRKADGVIKVLSQQSTVDQGDTLVSEKNTYARIKFVDNSEITLRPNTQFKIENFSYEAAKPENDNAIFTLIKGGLRSITGLLATRNKERFALGTPTATIGVRGTTFIAEYLPPDQPDMAAYHPASLAALASAQFSEGNPALANAPGIDAPQDFLPRGPLKPLQLAMANAPRTDAPQDLLPTEALRPLQLAQNTGGSGSSGRSPGLYVQVFDGMIHVTNGGGTQNFTAGQFGYTASFNQPPVVLPTNPGMQFSPPPSFSSTTGPQGGTGGAKPADVDCEVR